MADRSLTFTGSAEGPVGRCSDIAIYDDVVVMVYDKTLDTGLYYRVGTVDKENNTTTYGQERLYALGKVPSVTLIRYNNTHYVIATHQPDDYTSRVCYCCIGTVNVERHEINVCDIGEFRCAALKLKVSASDNGTVIIAHEKYYSYDGLCYHIGTLNLQTRSLDGIESCHKITAFSGVQPSLDIHDSTVVMVYHSRYKCELRSIVGTINKERTMIQWGMVTPLATSGIYPSISVNAQGDVVESHQSKFFRRIMRVWGKVQNQQIEWKANSLTLATFGEYPTLSLADDGYIVEAHKTNLGMRLFLSDGRLS